MKQFLCNKYKIIINVVLRDFCRSDAHLNNEDSSASEWNPRLKHYCGNNNCSNNNVGFTRRAAAVKVLNS